MRPLLIGDADTTVVIEVDPSDIPKIRELAMEYLKESYEEYHAEEFVELIKKRGIPVEDPLAQFLNLDMLVEEVEI